MLIKLAWRNLWRQKRRTILTACALALALILSLVMRSTQEGSYANNIENSARFSTGLIQLQHPDFADTQSIDDLLPEADSFIATALKVADVERALPRIASFSLAAAGDKSKGVMVLGVNPELENDYSGIASKLVEGAFIHNEDKQVLVGQGLAKYFNLHVGDDIVLYGQGYRGQTAAGLYAIKGILHFPISELDNQLIYMPLPLAQTLFSTEKQVTSWVLHTHELGLLDHTVDQLMGRFTEHEVSTGSGVKVNVRDWKDLSPEMAQQIAMDKAGGIFMMYLLYGVVGFGLFATILMMTLERQREFGVMLATGLLRVKLLALVMLESVFISVLGIAIGLVIATPVLIWFNLYPIKLTGETAQLMLDMGWEPIIPMMLAPRLFFDQILIVLILMSVCLIYPLWRVYHLDLVTALKGGEHAH